MHPIILASLTIAKNAVEKFETDKHVVFIDKEGNRFIHTKDNEFNMLFRKADGFTAKWGKTIEEDPTHSPIGPEIADIELTKCCAGIRDVDGVRAPCTFCYKNGSASRTYDFMSVETFKTVFDVWNKYKTLTQIAFGTDASLLESSNPDYWKIFDYCTKNGVTPNVTVADVDEETAKKMASTFGACAVSYYPLRDKNRCYDSVHLISTAAQSVGRKMAVNIHAMVSKETYPLLFDLIKDAKTDDRLKNLNAIVFLSLKQKGRGAGFSKVTQEHFNKLVNSCMEAGLSYGFDSCFARRFIESIKGHPNEKQLVQMTEPCEKLMFSSYIDHTGTFFPCSFMEKEGDWKEGIKITKDTDILKDVWFNPKSVMDRSESLACIACEGFNKCSHYNI